MSDNPYHDPRWKIVRAAVLRRDDYQCQLKLKNCKGYARAVDHVIDWRDGGAVFEAHNLRAACISCNTAQRNTRVAARARRERDATEQTWIRVRW